MRLQVKEVAGYDEDVAFLLVPDGSSFGKRVLLVIGTCTLAQVINVIKESEMDKISTPWVTVCLAQLLLRCVMTEESHKDKNTASHETMDEVIEMKDNVCVGPFQAEILKGRVAQMPTQDTHVMVAPIRCTDMV